MSKFQDYYKDAERLSVKEGKTQREISELLGISEKTISRWSSDGEWMRQRKEYLVSTRTGPADKLKKTLIEMLEQINPRDILESTRITDQITKIIAAIEKIEGGRDVLGATIETMDRFTRYLMRAEEDKQLIGKISERIHGFFEETRRM
ncbi:hypothetical protein BIY37_04720 [Candidatus Brocadia sapporoensis]|uniref:Uncharacterized protein n=1 Tax=Candidatus Brocadia sapporoensis TaxID=392547 RepID=A0A1V6M188_9BACT|nr:helix-turn-helix domain-containing protein [Candidatus Brocadia sapporoensis]MDG6005538.1 hypothetical protein [Candidatus Brocadia sp.]OQD46127.1 hypothetical protein BIY37_04720 [Candidatus Brocadia sapporoensis]GJQ23586.1 MAG: hypothetical protein HBSAPP01_13760 [Candidatus Brocadia sapporoensis]